MACLDAHLYEIEYILKVYTPPLKHFYSYQTEYKLQVHAHTREFLLRVSTPFLFIPPINGRTRIPV
jgi:hypothetical protein